MATLSTWNSQRIEPQLAILTWGQIRPLFYSFFFSVSYTMWKMYDSIIIRKM